MKLSLPEYRVSGDAQAAHARLAALGEHLLDVGLGTVSEIVDGAPPHRPCGCPAQACSVSCTPEAWVDLERAWRLDARRTDARRDCRPLKETSDDGE